ncbi:ribonuclease P protein component [Verrucomicrobium sp. GAS474]|uniref:ribonuclease P protein component n=1 Tax=Verrucomicrobium sp. GAS474 TaxID=1882831 RepID=UPI00087DE690|nr:ribonuclease P protein component [Verrucomicrobium sp. GAS474]SDU01504.1 ribonuclease P protein component [Verrucomicrobium sp. GAS474]
MRERLPRRRIVRRRHHFDAAFSGEGASGALRFHGRALTLLALPRKPGDTSPDEVAFLTPKRLGDANVRNRLRRRLREVHRRHIAPQFAASPPSFRLLWMAKSSSGALPFPELVSQMEALYATALAKVKPPDA